jgi:ABC-type transport system involved in cytochrome c biogenesis permease subunit
MGVLTLTPCAPSSTSSAPTTPSSTASTSMVALSVSISAITSPADTLSPLATSHFASAPSSMVGESAGIRT